MRLRSARAFSRSSSAGQRCSGDADPTATGRHVVFMKMATGALHLYQQSPHDRGCNAISHLGSQVAALDDLYARMAASGLRVGKPIRDATSCPRLLTVSCLNCCTSREPALPPSSTITSGCQRL